jgi:hypothetical protein
VPGFDLNKAEGVVLAGHDVDLAARGAVVADKDIEPEFAEESAS